MRKNVIKKMTVNFVILLSLSFLLFLPSALGNKQEEKEVDKPILTEQDFGVEEREEIIIKSVISDLKVEAKSDFTLREHFHVQSSLNGDITNRARLSETIDTATLGQQRVEVMITDGQGYQYGQQLNFTIVDTTPPQIKAENLVITIGETVDLLDEVTATDTVDGDLTTRIEFTSELVPDQVGDYFVHYQVSDKSHNIAKLTRTVSIIAEPSPEFESYVEPTNRQQAPTPTDEYQEPEVTIQSSTPTQVISQRIQFLGYDIPYQNGGMSAGQSIIDNQDIASTWGGNAYQSGYDQGNTHFIGHNPGIFSALFSLYPGVEISISDSEGNISVYQVTNSFEVDKNAIGIADGVDYWDVITGSGGGERVTFQTCMSETVNLIVQAAWIR